MLPVYSIYFLYCLLVFGCAYIFSKSKKKRYSFLLTTPLKEAEIYESLLTLENDYIQLNKQEKLKNYPHISRYLSDTTTFLDDSGGDIDFMSIIVDEAQKIEDVDQNNVMFSKEIESCPAEISNLVIRKNLIAIKIMMLQEMRSDYCLNIKRHRQYLQVKLFFSEIIIFFLKPLAKEAKLLDFKNTLEYMKTILEFSQRINACSFCESEN